jgi:hypothetical protein
MQNNQSPPHFLARVEGIAKGKALRNQVPRSSHGYAQMNPIEVWYDQIGVDSLLTFTNHPKEVKKSKGEVKKAQALTPTTELHKLTEIVQGQQRSTH